MRRVKWDLIICLEILMPLKGSLSEKLLWMAISFPVPKHAMGAAPAGAAFQQVCHPPPLPLSALMAASPSP